MQEIKKVVVIGPESTGKSTLCKQLASHYKTIWCAEYAREYLLSHGTKYTFDDLLVIAKGQLILEEKCVEKLKGEEYEVRNNYASGKNAQVETQQISNDQLLFIDTNMYVMKVWCEFVFEKCHQFILDTIVERKYDMYLLCNIDLPWIKDELREYPDLETREKLFHIYKDILINQQVPWAIISGTNEERLQQAILYVEQL